MPEIEVKNSLLPPYPTFADHLQRLMNPTDGSSPITAKEIAELVGTEEVTVHGWSTGSDPNRRYFGKIRKDLDYNFYERRFYEAATEVGFPQPNAPEELRGIQSWDSLRRYLSDIVKTTSIIELAKALDVPAQVLGDLFHDRSHPSLDLLRSIVKNIDTIPDQLNGTNLTPLTPKTIIAKTSKDCRLRRRLYLRQMAQILHVDEKYYSDLEACADRPADTKHFNKHRPRMVSICEILTRLRAEEDGEGKGITKTVSIPSVFHTHSAISPSTIHVVEPPTSGRGSVLTVDAKDEASPDIVQRLSDLESQLRTLASEVSDLRQRVDTLTVSTTVASAPKETPYVSPLSERRLGASPLVPDAMYARMLKAMIDAVSEHLALTPSIADRERRSFLQETLRSSVFELFAAIDGHVRADAGLSALVAQIESWRRGFRAFNETPEKNNA